MPSRRDMAVAAPVPRLTIFLFLLGNIYRIQPVLLIGVVLSKGLVLGLIGIGTGALFSISVSSLLATLLYDVQTHDPAIFLSVPVRLLLVTLLATYIPALRATKVDPMVALREA